MDEKLVETIARAAGLDLALENFRDDLIAAAGAVESQRRALRSVPALLDEPWPPMRVPDA